MEYTVQKLGNLAGISTRTLRYYDEIGILKPARINSSGYRIYGLKEVDKLQQILFYRELGLSLKNIKEVITSPTFDGLAALKKHYDKLLDKKDQINKLISNVEKTIAQKEGKIDMTDEEKFEGFKQKMIDENERKYGKEMREKHGVKRINKSNQKLKGISQVEYEKLTKLENKVIEILHSAFQTGDPSSDLAQKAADTHKQWLTYYWEDYTKEAHAGLAEMYVDDERFTAYYDEKQPGIAKFLRDAILIYTGMGKK